MPQSGCKTFSFIFKYKKSSARDANAFSIMFRWYVLLLFFFFLVGGGQLIDAHAHAARGEERGGAAMAEVYERLYLTGMWVPYLLRTMIYYNFMHESVQSGVGVALGKMSSVANLLTLPNERCF